MLCTNLYGNSEDFIDYAGKPPRRLPDPDLYGLGPLYRLYRCREGWIFLACTTQREWTALTASLGDPRLANDACFATPQDRAAHETELAAALLEVFRRQDAGYWESCLSAANVGCVVADKRYYEFFQHDPQIEANGRAVPTAHPQLGPYLRYGAHIDFSLTPEPTGGAMPLTGQHSRSILKELGYSEGDLLRLRDEKVITWPE
jgi:crotonobetainyl-CoA:carnitine CoA-transferase CaiB-like acyl-CoA transferase